MAGTVLPSSDAGVTVSMGVASFAAGVQAVQFVDALTAADRSLYQAKVSGRNRVCLRDIDPTDPTWLEPPPQVRRPGD